MKKIGIAIGASLLLHFGAMGQTKDQYLQYNSEKGGYITLTPEGFHIEEMMLYDGRREKKIWISRCSIPTEGFADAIQHVDIILDGVPANIGDINISVCNWNESPKHHSLYLSPKIPLDYPLYACYPKTFLYPILFPCTLCL